jgi:diphosphomevalonate decarboxylase
MLGEISMSSLTADL